MKKLIFLVLLTCMSAAQVSYARNSQLSCLLEPSKQIEMASQIRGVVKSVNVQRGQRVSKGQLLVVMENDLEANLLVSAKERADFAQRRLDRNRNLLDKQLLADNEADELRTERKLADLAVVEAQVRLQRRSLFSPIDGIVTKRYLQVGEYVGEDPILQLVSLDPLHAELVLRADAYGLIENGMVLDIDIFGTTTVRRKAEVKVVDQLIDAASGTYGVQLVLDNPGNQLPSGLKCQVHLDVGS